MSGVSPLSGISGLYFDSTLLSPLLFFLPSSVTLSALSLFCLLALAHSPELFPNNSSIFFVKRQAFLYGPCLAAKRSKLVGGMCSMLPYGSGMCCYAFNNFFDCFCPFLFVILKKKNLVLINRRNGPQNQRVLALRAFLTGVIPKGLILRIFCV